MAETIQSMQIENSTLLKYTGEEDFIHIPEYIERVSPYAFADCTSLKKVILPIRLKSIGKGAFYGCTNLAEVTMPGRLYLRAKGGNVFPTDLKIYFRFYVSTGERLEDTDYSDVFATKEEYTAAVKDDSAAYIQPPEEFVPKNFTPTKDVPQIPAEEVDSTPKPIGHSVQPEYTFDEHVDVPAPVYEQPDDDIDPRTLEERIQDIVPEDKLEEPQAVHNRIYNSTDYVIDGDIAVKYIGSSKETIVPDYIRHIGPGAFANTDVEGVTLPDGLETIDKDAFSWCRNLREINFPEGMELIDDGAFANCESLVHISLPQTLKFIGADAFRACSALKDFAIPQSVQTINRRAFDFCVSLQEMTVPENITVIAEGLFSHCENLSKINLPSGVTEIGSWAFAECYRLRQINLAEGIVTIGEVAFLNCRSLVAVDLPKSLKILGRQAFVGCQSLHLVNLSRHLEGQVKNQKCFHKLPSVRLNFE